MDTKDLICISCPLGCQMTVSLEDNKVISIEGNSCPRGEIYAKKEVTNPERLVTSTVRLIGGNSYLVSVKTEHEVPKNKIFDVMKVINKTSINSPVKVGDIIVKNIADTGINLVATNNG